jgi:hypothetical protein
MRGPSLLLGILLLIGQVTPARAQFWCWEADEVIADTEDDIVRIQHLAALYNCCPDPVTYNIEVGDATILVEEYTLAPCNCDCCMDLEVVLVDVPAGPWNILFRWFDLESGQWTGVILEVIIPDVGQQSGPFLAETARTDCLEASSVPDLSDAPLTWGYVKAMYR